MDTFTSTMVSNFHPPNTLTNEITKTQFFPKPFYPTPTNFPSRNLHFRRPLVATSVEETEKAENGGGKPKFKWVEVGPGITESQKEAISQLSPKMTKRCRALMKQLICFSAHEASLNELLAAWVRIMKPQRADWLAIIKQLKIMDHPLYFQVFFFNINFKALIPLSFGYLFIFFFGSAVISSLLRALICRNVVRLQFGCLFIFRLFNIKE